jgi:Ca-activated chloride channel homolog
MENSKMLTLSAETDFDLVPEAGRCIRHIMVTIQAPKLELDQSEEGRKDLNLALVVDASGSMRGLKLVSAKQAAKGLAESMQDTDVLSVVSFSSESHIHVRRQAMDANGCHVIQRKISEITDSGVTNLSNGWLDGAQCVAEMLNEESNHINRVLVLSDGHANRGIQQPVELSEIARNLKERGIFSSCVGIGDDYSTRQLQAIADSGGGQLHDAELPQEIVEVVLGEFGDLAETYAEDVSVKIGTVVGATVSVLAQFDTESENESLVCHIGSLLVGRSRSVVFQIEMSPEARSGDFSFPVSVHWSRPGEQERIEVELPPQHFHLVETDQITLQERDPEIGLRVASAWQTHVATRSLQLNAEKNWDEARKLILETLVDFEPYCTGIPGTETFVHELRELAGLVGFEMGSRTRKNMNRDLYLSKMDVRDHRSKQLRSWKETLLSGAGHSERNHSRRRSGGSQSRERGLQMEFPLMMADGHLIVEVDGLRLLVDSGVPTSIGMYEISICGQPYQVDGSFMGVSIHSLRQFIDTPLDGVIGMDILKDWFVELNVKKNLMRISGDPLLQRHGSTMKPLNYIMGVPVINIQLAGQNRSMFFDTGAKLSYIHESLSIRNASEGRVEDFYPGLGRFVTDTYKMVAELNQSEQLTCHFGILPEVLQDTLMVMGVQGIVGCSVLETYSTTISFPDSKICFEKTQ